MWSLLREGHPPPSPGTARPPGLPLPCETAYPPPQGAPYSHPARGLPARAAAGPRGWARPRGTGAGEPEPGTIHLPPPRPRGRGPLPAPGPQLLPGGNARSAGLGLRPELRLPGAGGAWGGSQVSPLSAGDPPRLPPPAPPGPARGSAVGAAVGRELSPGGGDGHDRLLRAKSGGSASRCRPPPPLRPHPPPLPPRPPRRGPRGGPCERAPPLGRGRKAPLCGPFSRSSLTRIFRAQPLTAPMVRGPRLSPGRAEKGG